MKEVKKENVGEFVVEKHPRASSFSSYSPTHSLIILLTSIDAEIKKHLKRLALDLVGRIAQKPLMIRAVVEDSNRKDEQRVNLEPVVEEIEGAAHFVDGDDAVDMGGRRRNE